MYIDRKRNNRINYAQLCTMMMRINEDIAFDCFRLAEGARRSSFEVMTNTKKQL